jgi:hypothetical protein
MPINKVLIFAKGLWQDMDVAKSKNEVPIRLTGERWFHITEEHSEIPQEDVVIPDWLQRKS